MADGLTARQVAHRLGQAYPGAPSKGTYACCAELTGARSIGELCAVSVAERAG